MSNTPSKLVDLTSDLIKKADNSGAYGSMAEPITKAMKDAFLLGTGLKKVIKQQNKMLKKSEIKQNKKVKKRKIFACAASLYNGTDVKLAAGRMKARSRDEAMGTFLRELEEMPDLKGFISTNTSVAG